MTNENDIFQTIGEDTRPVSNPHLYEPTPDDFEDNTPDLVPEDEVIDPIDNDDNVPVVSVLDSEETTEIAITMLDAVQSSVFTILQKKQLIKRYFSTSDAYKQGREIAHMDDEEIKAKFEDKADKMLGLKRRYVAMTAAYTSGRAEMPLTEDEKSMITPSLKKMVEKSGMDIPPNLALMIAVGQIVGGRLATIYWD